MPPFIPNQSNQSNTPIFLNAPQWPELPNTAPTNSGFIDESYGEDADPASQRQMYEPRFMPRPKRRAAAKICQTCCNCGLLGHRLRHCMKAAPDGFLHGCPRCDDMSHDFDACHNLKKRPGDWYLFSVRHRIGRCPLKQSKDLRLDPDFTAVQVKPWTASFARSRNHLWRDHIHLQDQEEEQLVPDPAWNNPAAIPVDELAFPYPNGRPPSPDMRKAHPRGSNNFWQMQRAPQRDFPSRAHPQPQSINPIQILESTTRLIAESNRESNETARQAIEALQQTQASNDAKDARHLESNHQKDLEMLSILNRAFGDSSTKRKREDEELQYGNSVRLQPLYKKHAVSVNDKPTVVHEDKKTVTFEGGGDTHTWGKPTLLIPSLMERVKIPSPRFRPRKGRNLQRLQAPVSTISQLASKPNDVPKDSGKKEFGETQTDPSQPSIAALLNGKVQPFNGDEDVLMGGVQKERPPRVFGNTNDFLTDADFHEASPDACTNCGKYGHAEQKCPDMQCGKCGQINHKASKCKSKAVCKCKQFPKHNSSNCKEICRTKTCPKVKQHPAMMCTDRCAVCGSFRHAGFQCSEGSCSCRVGYHLGQNHRGGCMVVGCGSYYCLEHCETCGLKAHVSGRCPYKISRTWPPQYRIPRKSEHNNNDAGRRPQRLFCDEHKSGFTFAHGNGCDSCHNAKVELQRREEEGDPEWQKTRDAVNAEIDEAGGYKQLIANRDARNPGAQGSASAQLTPLPPPPADLGAQRLKYSEVLCGSTAEDSFDYGDDDFELYPE